LGDNEINFKLYNLIYKPDFVFLEIYFERTCDYLLKHKTRFSVCNSKKLWVKDIFIPSKMLILNIFLSIFKYVVFIL